LVKFVIHTVHRVPKYTEKYPYFPHTHTLITSHIFLSLITFEIARTPNLSGIATKVTTSLEASTQLKKQSRGLAPLEPRDYHPLPTTSISGQLWISHPSTTQNTPATPPGPFWSITSQQGRRFDPHNRGTPSTSDPSKEYQAITRLLAEAGSVCLLSPPSFLTVFNPNVRNFSDGDLAIIPLLLRLVTMVQGLGLTVETLFSQVATLSLKLCCTQRNDTPQPLAQTTATLEATIRDLGARVSTLASAQLYPARDALQ